MAHTRRLIQVTPRGLHKAGAVGAVIWTALGLASFVSALLHMAKGLDAVTVAAYVILAASMPLTGLFLAISFFIKLAKGRGK